MSDSVGRPAGYTETDSARELLEWCADWRAGMFSPAHTADGWTVEMYGLVESTEKIAAEFIALVARLAAEEARANEAAKGWSTVQEDLMAVEAELARLRASNRLAWKEWQGRALKAELALQSIQFYAENQSDGITTRPYWHIADLARRTLAAAEVSARYPGAEATPETGSLPGGLASEPRGTDTETQR